MSSYELMLLFDPNLGEEAIDGIVSKVNGKIKAFGAEVDKIDKWGSRHLASTLGKAPKLTQAYYVVIYFNGETKVPKELSNYLKVTENVVRYSVLRASPKTEKNLEERPATEIEAVDIGEIKGEAGGQS